MSAHPDAFERLGQKLVAARDPEVVDQLLDQWSDYRDRATDWDGDQWGFDPDTWMKQERAEMAKLENIRDFRSGAKQS